MAVGLRAGKRARISSWIVHYS